VTRIAPDALYPVGTVTARVLSESVLLLGGPRALLMQLAHPAVAAGVADHSGFDADPFGRLVRTLDAMNTIAFGAPGDADAVLDHLRRVHSGVKGTTVGGDAYEANDPDLLFWVHATLVDTVLVVERRYLGYLDEAGQDQYYEESKQMATRFEIPDGLVPPDRRSFESFMDEQARTLEVSTTARSLARAILHPRVGPIPPPAWEPLRLVTVDMLPRPIREGYGLGWDRRRKRLVQTSQAVSRLVLPRIPPPVRNLPTATRRGLARAG